MTSKKSLWVNKLENHKRRIVVWILSILGNVMIYPVVLLMYYTRIRARYARGDLKNIEYFREQMKQATCDALCFEPKSVFLASILAVMIVVHGFSYLYSRRKQDLYLSVPVSMKERFRIIYINGIVLYIITSVLSIAAALLFALFEGAIDGNLFGRVCLSYLFVFLFFMCVYNLALLALMLTGNVVITGAGFIVLLLYGTVAVTLMDGYAVRFFDRIAGDFRVSSVRLFLPDLYIGGADRIVHIKALGKVFTVLLPYMGGMILYAAVTLFMIWWLYKRRPAEAAGDAIAFRMLKPVLKLLLIVPCALLGGLLVYEMTEESVAGLISAIIAGGVLTGMTVEVIFEKDIRAALHHMILTVAGTCAALAVFGVIKLDLTGYDSYVPKPEEIESYAICDRGSHNGRNDHWEYVLHDENAVAIEGQWDYFQPQDGGYYSRYVDQVDYIREHMFLKDTEAICALANKTLGAKSEDLSDREEVSVLYRLKNGREVARAVWFDFGDELSAPFLDRIYGAPEYVDGFYQAAHMDEIERDDIRSLTYTNGIRSVSIDEADEKALAQAWVNDMKQADFTYFRSHLPVGQIEMAYWSYRAFVLPVYEDFTETIAYLEQRGNFIPQENIADEVDCIIVKYHDTSENSPRHVAAGRIENVAVLDMKAGEFSDIRYDDKQRIAEILEVSYSSNLCASFVPQDLFCGNPSVEVMLSPSDEFLPEDERSVFFNFLAGKIPDFVIQDLTEQ